MQFSITRFAHLVLALLLLSASGVLLSACGKSSVSGEGTDGGIDDVRRVLPDGRVVLPDGGEVDSGIEDGSRPGLDATVPDTSVGPDASVGPDGGVVDGGPGLGTGTIGDPCTTNDDCDGRFCATGLGYCTWLCADDIPCPGDTLCVTFSGTVGYCLPPCELGDPASCADGLVCTASAGTPAPVCLSGCDDEEDCPEGSICGPGWAPEVGACYAPEGTEGSECASTAECGLGFFCADEANWGFPRGICLRFGCDERGGGGCSDTTSCVPYEFGMGGVCLGDCVDDGDCRPGYACAPGVREGEQVCVPRCRSNDECNPGNRCDFLTGRCVDPASR